MSVNMRNPQEIDMGNGISQNVSNNSAKDTDNNSDNTLSIEEIYKQVVQKGYKALLMGIIFFIVYIFIGQINNFFNYSILVDASTLSSFSTTNELLKSGTQTERTRDIKRSQESIVKNYTNSFKKIFTSKNSIQSLYCVDTDGYMQSLTAFNTNSKTLLEKLRKAIGNEKPTKENIEKATTSLLLMAYEACGDITTNIYVADMGTIRGGKVSTSIINISKPFSSDGEQLVAKAYYYMNKVWNFTPSNDYVGRLLELKQDVDKIPTIEINKKNILNEIPVSILSISRQTISTKFLAPNLKVKGISIPMVKKELATWLGVLGLFGGIKYSLSALLYSFPITSFIFTNYISLIIFLLYTGLLIVMIEFVPSLVFIYKNKHIRKFLLNGFDITIKFCYNIMMIIIFITILTSIILPLLLIFF